MAISIVALCASSEMSGTSNCIFASSGAHNT
jgi:hypothetical protein